MIHVHTMFLLVISMVILQWYFCFLVLLVLYLLPAHLSTSQVEHHDGTIPWYNRVTPPTTAAMDVIVPAGRWADWTDWPDVTVSAGDADRVTPVGATKAMDAMVALAKERKSREIKWVGAKMAEVDKLLWSSYQVDQNGLVKIIWQRSFQKSAWSSYSRKIRLLAVFLKN